MVQNECLRMTAEYPRTTAVNSLHADIPVSKLDEYVQLLVINTRNMRK
jgi:hypothetical protein